MSSTQPHILLLIDGHALIYRAYHAFPGLSTKEGMLVNAVYGFSRILLTALRDFSPTYVAVAFDHPKPTFRHEAFTEYKAHRVAMPDDLKAQIPLVKDVVTALNMPQFELPGFEADDLIGTITKQAKTAVTDDSRPVRSVIVTGDRDAFQLVDDDTRVWMPGRGKGSVDTEYDRDSVKSKMGVWPEQIIDLKALMGDASDNIPGVKGVGEKTALSLIQQFESLDGVYQALPTAESLKPALREKLERDKDQAFLSQQLATINRDVPISLELGACRVTEYDKTAATDLFESLGFVSLVPLLPQDEFEQGVQSALF